MPVQFRVDAEENLATITLTENYDAPSLIKTMKEVVSVPAFRPKTRILVDESEVTILPSNEGARSVARIQGSIFRGHCVVTIAPANVLYGVNRMISSLADMEGCCSAVFKTLPEAVNWLKLDCLEPESASKKASSHRT